MPAHALLHIQTLYILRHPGSSLDDNLCYWTIYSENERGNFLYYLSVESLLRFICVST